MTKTQTIKTRETRVIFTGSDASFGVAFKLPGGEIVTIADHTLLPGATITHALQYGIRRLYQDGLAGAIKDGADADSAARDLIARFESGNFTRRSAGGVTMEKVARAAIRASAWFKTETRTAEQVGDIFDEILVLN